MQSGCPGDAVPVGPARGAPGLPPRVCWSVVAGPRALTFDLANVGLMAHGRNAAFWQVKDFVAELKAQGRPVEITRFGVPRGFHDPLPHPVCNTHAAIGYGTHGASNSRSIHIPPSECVHKTSDCVQIVKAPNAPPVGRWSPSTYGYHYEFATSRGHGHTSQLFERK